MKKFLGRVLLILLLAASLSGVLMMTLNNHVVNSQKDNIVFSDTGNLDKMPQDKIDKLKDFNSDAIVVLGAGIKDSETPTPMLKDRLDTGIALYQMGFAPKILLTGDNGTEYHDEIHVMLSYTINAGVPPEDIFCDHAGFSTYDSIYRASSIFQIKKPIVVTQSYHEYRSLHISEEMGLTALGVASDQDKYSGQPIREIREVLARVKDFFKCIAKPDPLCGGEIIPITGDGRISHGE